MIGAVGQGNLYIHHRIAGQHARLHGALDTGVHSGNKLLGNSTADHGVDKLVALAGLVGLQSDLHMAVLAGAAALALVLGLVVDLLAHRLLVGHLGSAHVGLHLELAEQTVHDDLQVQLAHAGDDGLTRFLVGIGAEGGILLSKLGQGKTHLLLAGLGLGLNGHADHGLGELHGFQNDGVLFVAKGIAGGGILQAHHSSNVAGIDRFQILTVVGVHLQQTTHTLALALGGVEHGGAGVQRSGIDAEEAEPAHIRIGHDLECQCGEGLIIRRMTVFLLVGLGIGSLDSGNVSGGGHIVHDGIQQLLDALVAVRRAADHRHHFHGHGGLADGFANLGRGDLLPFQIHLHDLIIEHGNSIQQLFPVLIGQVHHVLGDRLYAHILAQLIVINISIHLHQVDDTLEGILLTDGELNGHGVALETVMHHVQHMEEIRAGDIHLIDVDHPGDMIVIRLTPHSLRLGLHAALGAHDGDRSVQHTQRTLHLYSKVHMARSINDVDTGLGELILGALPVAGGCSGGDGDATLLLLLHPVHGGRTLVGLANFIIDARIVQNALRSGGLACINVGHDADISCVFQCNLSRHTVLLFLPIIPRSPTEMGECLVGFGHLVGILAFLNCAAGVVGSIHDLTCQALGHGALAAGAGICGQPAQTQGLTAGGTHFHGDLIGSTAHTAGLNLEAGHDIFHGLGENFQRLLVGLLLDDVKGTIDDLLSHALLTVQHNAVDELRHQHRAVHRIGQNFSLGNITSSGHFASLLHKNMIS